MVIDQSVSLRQIQELCPTVFRSRQRVAQVVPTEARTIAALPGVLYAEALSRQQKAEELIAEAEELTRAASLVRAQQETG